MNDLLVADTTRFPHDTIDGETVIIDATCGHLFLLTGLGPWLWHRMIAGHSIDGLSAEVAARFGAEAEDATRRFLGELVANGMLQPQSSAEPAAGEPAALPDAFVPPAVERYDEIADIIAMDPIHDVDPTKGWPHRQGNVPAADG
ncbi:MAG: PqqD family protein [Planctomycetia bacterium]|nr:PqqD family protein [Planctomycetia bacterium]